VTDLEDGVDRLAAETGFSGVVRVDRGGVIELAKAYGLAHRGAGLANTIDTQFGIASGTKGFTALAAVSLIEEGRLELSTTARDVLGADLPLIDDRVTVEHLLAHRSGIGDYLDEEVEMDVTDYLMPIPVQQLTTAESYLRVLDGYPSKFDPDERFSYCNGGFVVLAVIVERVSGTPFQEVVMERVCGPAGLVDTAFLRSDEPKAGVALGYPWPEGLRTNVLHLPVIGNGDGGIYTTAADVHAFWAAFLAGKIVSSAWVERMVEPRSDVPTESKRYGLGFWLHESSDAVILIGGDAGVSFQSVVDPTNDVVHTVISNTTDGTWPVAEHLDRWRTG
jgi:CubicO group peptidase (beta-lactamase class C family)